jgi:cardiolipin synthase
VPPQQQQPPLTDRIATLPNALSALRLAGVPLLAWLLLVRHADGWALAVLVASGATDWLDGKLARVLGQMSKLGALMDPLADRLYVIVALLTFAARGFFPWWLAAVLIGRDAVLALTLPVYRRRGLPPPTVIYLGKAATFALMCALPVVLMAQLHFPGAFAAHAVGYALLAWGTGLYLLTGVSYLARAVGVARSAPPLRRPR